MLPVVQDCTEYFTFNISFDLQDPRKEDLLLTSFTDQETETREVKSFVPGHTANKSQRGMHSKSIHRDKHMAHTEGWAEHPELIFPGIMFLTGQGYPKLVLPHLGYESL